MNVKISRATCEGEITEVSFTVNGEKDIAKMANAYRLLDTRMLEMNNRLLAAHGSLAEFPPELRGKIRYLVDCLHFGRGDQLNNLPRVAGTDPQAAETEAINKAKEAETVGTPQGS